MDSSNPVSCENVSILRIGELVANSCLLSRMKTYDFPKIKMKHEGLLLS